MPKKSEGYNRISLRAPNAKHLQRLIDSEVVKDSNELAAAFGVSRTAASAWLRGVYVPPQWTLVAAEGLTRRSRVREKLLIVRLPDKANIGLVVKVIEELGGEAVTLEQQRGGQ